MVPGKGDELLNCKFTDAGLKSVMCKVIGQSRMTFFHECKALRFREKISPSASLLSMKRSHHKKWAVFEIPIPEQI